MPGPHLEFVNFLIRIASSKAQLQAFLDDPSAVAAQAGLSSDQVNALVDEEGAVRLNELVKTDLSNWLLAAFQGVPDPIDPQRKAPQEKKKTGTGKRKTPGKPGKK